MKRFARWLSDLFTPFAVIASELRIIRTLYELELMEREKPIIRITEAPSDKDTEVTYADDAPTKKSVADRMRDALMGDEEEEELP